MKRFLAMMLSFVLLLSLAACSQNTDPTDPIETDASTASPTEADTTPATEPDTEPEVLQLPMSAIFMPTVTEEVYAEDGTVIFRTIYQDVSLTMPDTDCADDIILDLLQRLDGNQDSDAELLEWARQAYTGPEYWTPYFSEIHYEPVRMDEKVLSLYGTNMSYGGGVHPNYTSVSVTYDLATGKALTLADVLVDEAAAEALCGQIIDTLSGMQEEYFIYDDYERTVNERYGTVFDTNWESTSFWYLSTEGLCVYFSPYEIAPYASGTIEILLPYGELTGILKDDFFPAQLPDAAAGTVEAVLAQDMDLNEFTQFAEAILDEEGEQVLLHSDGLVANVRLELGQWDEDGINYYPSGVIFAANTLTPGDAIMLRTYFSDTMPSLRLRYTAGGTEYRFFITQSGKDGSIILLEDLT